MTPLHSHPPTLRARLTIRGDCDWDSQHARQQRWVPRLWSDIGVIAVTLWLPSHQVVLESAFELEEQACCS